MIKFGELRNYISRIDRVSVCMKDDFSYENFRYIREVPKSYDEYQVYGIGQIESEFLIAEAFSFEIEGRQINKTMFLAPCIEIMLDRKEEPQV
ncbi:MAG: hypothetical protein HFI33_08575 [Lachnospiraceae bacterium]|nr:hypothetical protein [Lachnospiraceae bacterium]